MSMPDTIQAQQYKTLREEINSFITPEGEPAEDALSIVCYTLERALQQCSSGMGKGEYLTLHAIAELINEEGSGSVAYPATWEIARENSKLITDFAETYAANAKAGIELPTGFDYPELTDDEIATALAMAERL